MCTLLLNTLWLICGGCNCVDRRCPSVQSTVQLERKLIRIISHGDNFMKLDGIEVLGVTDAQMGVSSLFGDHTHSLPSESSHFFSGAAIGLRPSQK